MGLLDDLKRYREVGEENREDLADFIQHGDLAQGNPDIQVPVKIVSIPEFEYDKRDMGGVGQGQGGTPQPGQPMGQPQPGDGDEEGEPGEEAGEHEYYDMDPEEFAEELDEELGLDLEPKGKEVVEEVEGAYKEVARQGPDSTLDFERMFKEGLKRKLAADFDEDFMREVLKTEGIGPRRAYEWARGESIPVSYAWLEQEYDEVSNYAEWDSIEQVEEEVGREPTQQRIRREGIDEIPFRPDDKRYRHPEIEEEYDKSAVIVNIRDVSGSMREKKRELVERTFVPMDWYLQGKYDNAEFIYIAHDSDAWEVEREDFFGIKSGGGTKISSAYELADELLEEYPWENWNRYIFAAGDSENSSNDTKDRVMPLMEEIDANLHAYVEAQPGKDGIGQKANASHAEELQEYKEEYGMDDWAVTHVGKPEDATDAIYDILSTESGER